MGAKKWGGGKTPRWKGSGQEPDNPQKDPIKKGTEQIWRKRRRGPELCAPSPIPSEGFFRGGTRGERTRILRLLKCRTRPKAMTRKDGVRKEMGDKSWLLRKNPVGPVCHPQCQKSASPYMRGKTPEGQTGSRMGSRADSSKRGQ